MASYHCGKANPKVRSLLWQSEQLSRDHGVSWFLWRWFFGPQTPGKVAPHSDSITCLSGPRLRTLSVLLDLPAFSKLCVKSELLSQLKNQYFY